MPKNLEKGVTLIITFFILTIILVVVLSLSIILYKEIKIIRNIGNSVVSFYAADSGIEKVLYYDRKGGQGNAESGICDMCDLENPSCPPPSDPDFGEQGTACLCEYPLVGDDCDPSSCGSCTVSFSTSLNNDTNYSIIVKISTEAEFFDLDINSIGNFKNTKRAIQVISSDTGD